VGGGGAAREGYGRPGRARGDAGRRCPDLHNGGLDRSTAVCSVEPVDGKPVFTDGPYVETKEHLGGFAVVDVPDDEAARYWAGRLAIVLDWPQEVHRFRGPGQARRNGSGEK
jgi:YCII-related domain